jgi:hypothetical protein
LTDKKEKPCGNSECGISTGICGSITAGTGEVDFNGYWEFPCYVCPKQFEHLNEVDEDSWMNEPLTKEESDSMVKAMKEFEAGETEEW